MYDTDFLSINQWEWTEAGCSAVCNQLNAALSSYVDGSAVTAKFKIKFYPELVDGSEYKICGKITNDSSSPTIVRIAKGGSFTGTAIDGYTNSGQRVWGGAGIGSGTEGHGVGSGLYIVFGKSGFLIQIGTTQNTNAFALCCANDISGNPIFAGYLTDTGNNQLAALWSPSYPDVSGSYSFNILCRANNWPTDTDYVASNLLAPFPVPSANAGNFLFGLFHPVQFVHLASTFNGDVIMRSADATSTTEKRYYVFKGSIFLLLDDTEEST